MTIDELKKKRTLLEQDLLRIIKRFENETMLNFNSIKIGKYYLGNTLTPKREVEFNLDI